MNVWARIFRQGNYERQLREVELVGWRVDFSTASGVHDWKLAKEFPKETSRRVMEDYARERFCCYRIVALYSEDVVTVALQTPFP